MLTCTPALRSTGGGAEQQTAVGCRRCRRRRRSKQNRPRTHLLPLPHTQQGRLPEALECLLALEKQRRLAEDVTGTRLACCAVLDVLFAARDWRGLNEHILLLAKRRSQLKQARGCLRCGWVCVRAR